MVEVSGAECFIQLRLALYGEELGVLRRSRAPTIAVLQVFKTE